MAAQIIGTLLLQLLPSAVNFQQSLFTWCPTPWDFHVQLDGVHAQDGVSHVAQHVSAGGYAHKCWQLLQLLELGLPPEQGRIFSQAGCTVNRGH